MAKIDGRRAALIAVIAAQWLAIIGCALIGWWLLGAHLGHLAAGGTSLALSAVAVAFALDLLGMLRH